MNEKYFETKWHELFLIANNPAEQIVILKQIASDQRGAMLIAYDDMVNPSAINKDFPQSMALLRQSLASAEIKGE